VKGVIDAAGLVIVVLKEVVTVILLSQYHPDVAVY
jgi:hypothetical protein